ncbi:hypothetical protein EJ04DRAFT_169363 [Polyplosphaeria fusca]|uniref:C2H2-type domain-containing protein n=1 Tax=Polyplosphaeria fusca TaxID=682080 RepID=A0A9P4R1C1_9PLEO|nr:hypothetical protein EJ04DRAFT_169363 [Polyplosphaeria fusca]
MSLSLKETISLPTATPSSDGFRNHIKGGKCAQQKPFQCDACKQSFKHQKDLARHKTSGSCRAAKLEPKQLKQFACICGERNTSYSRHDSLLRHIREKNSRDPNRQHQCTCARCIDLSLR